MYRKLQRYMKDCTLHNRTTQYQNAIIKIWSANESGFLFKSELRRLFKTQFPIIEVYYSSRQAVHSAREISSMAGTISSIQFDGTANIPWSSVPKSSSRSVSASLNSIIPCAGKAICERCCDRGIVCVTYKSQRGQIKWQNCKIIFCVSLQPCVYMVFCTQMQARQAWRGRGGAMARKQKKRRWWRFVFAPGQPLPRQTHDIW